MLDTMLILRDGALMSLVASTYLLILLRFNPRIFLRHYPKEIREIVPPKSGKERRMSMLLGLLIGAPVTFCITLANRDSGKSLLLETLRNMPSACFSSSTSWTCSSSIGLSCAGSSHTG